MTGTNTATTLPKLPAEAIRQAHFLKAFSQAKKSWTRLLHPDQRDLIKFIVQNYDSSPVFTEFPIKPQRNLAYYPEIWAHEESQMRKAIERTLDLTSPLLEKSWRLQLGAISFLDLPTELILLMERELSDNELYNLCRTNRGLYQLLGEYLCKRGVQGLCALRWSVQNTKKEAFIKAIETLSGTETALHCAKRLHRMLNTQNAEVIEPLVPKDGFLGEVLDTLIYFTLHDLLRELWRVPMNEKNTYQTVKYVLRWGANPNYIFADGSSLMWHAIMSSTQISDDDSFAAKKVQDRSCRHVHLLLAHGADPNFLGSPEGTISTLHLASLHYQPRIVRALLKAGADPNPKDLRNYTPVHQLFELPWVPPKRRDALLDILIADQRVQLDERDNSGCTPLSLAASHNLNLSVVFTKRVLKFPKRVDINSQDNWGNTPLCRCIAANQTDIARLLLSQDRIDPNLGPTDGFPLWLAVCYRQEQTVKLLLDTNRLDINRVTSTGQTALTKAVDINSWEIVEMLAEAGADPEVGMSGGRTARQQALAKGIHVEWRICSV